MIMFKKMHFIYMKEGGLVLCNKIKSYFFLFNVFFVTVGKIKICLHLLFIGHYLETKRSCHAKIH